MHDLCKQLLPGWTPAKKLELPAWLVRRLPSLLGPLTGADAAVLA